MTDGSDVVSVGQSTKAAVPPVSPKLTSAEGCEETVHQRVTGP